MNYNARFVLRKSKMHEQYNLINELADKITYSFKSNYEVGRVLEYETDCDLVFMQSLDYLCLEIILGFGFLLKLGIMMNYLFYLVRKLGSLSSTMNKI